MQQHPAIGQHVTLTSRPGHQQQRPHRGRDTDAVGCHVCADELHRVVNGQPRADGTARRIDIEMDIGLRILVRKEEELGNHHIGRLISHGPPHKNDAIFQEP